MEPAPWHGTRTPAWNPHPGISGWCSNPLSYQARTVLFNFQTLSWFNFRKKKKQKKTQSIKNFKEIARIHYIEKSISKAWHKIGTRQTLCLIATVGGAIISGGAIIHHLYVFAKGGNAPSRLLKSSVPKRWHNVHVFDLYRIEWNLGPKLQRGGKSIMLSSRGIPPAHGSTISSRFPRIGRRIPEALFHFFPLSQRVALLLILSGVGKSPACF